MRNTLKCNITGAERVTNVPYLTTRADRLGITVEEYKENYVAKKTLADIKVEIAGSDIDTVSTKYGITVDTLTGYINFNGKNRFTPTMLVTA
jgi:hypothetical protein|tara:strand:+ start:1494 stop:1769 length:276 start_codon:yes stop_codon:yes gene_type:complete